MGKDVRNESRVCRTPPLLKRGIFITNSDRREIIVAASLITVLSIAALSTYNFWVPLPPPPPLGIAIDGDADFAATALLEGWPGDGSPENPFIIDGLDIDLGGQGEGECILIQNTRVNFIISNCNLTGASYRTFTILGTGIFLENVANGVLVNNTCNYNVDGIALSNSDFNTVANNTSSSNDHNGISLWRSEYNIVTNNTCNSNNEGILLEESNSNTVANNTLNGCGLFLTGTLAECRQLEVTGNRVNTLPLVFLQDQVGSVVSSLAGQVILVGCSQVMVKDQTLIDCSVGVLLCHTNLTTLADNTCNNNRIGIYIYDSDSNIVANNTCNSNDVGIGLHDSNWNTVANNTCNSNSEGITVGFSNFNTVANNTCSSNSESGIGVGNSDSNTVENNICNNNRGVTTITTPGGVGISLHAALGDSLFNCTVSNNTCSNNDECGIRIDAYHGTVSNNTVVNNTCTSNGESGISLSSSEFNTVANNTCNYNSDYGIRVGAAVGMGTGRTSNNTVVNNTCNNNRVGIYLYESYSNTVEDNTCLGNTEHDIVDEPELEELAHQEYVAQEFAWLLAGCGMILVTSVIAFVKFRRMEI